MEKLQCTNCGGKINPHTYVCEYCGTRYVKSEHMRPNLVIAEYPKVQTLAVETIVDRHMVETLGEEDASKYTIETMTQELASSLAPFLSIETRFDPLKSAHIVRGKVRVMDPSFRF